MNADQIEEIVMDILDAKKTRSIESIKEDPKYNTFKTILEPLYTMVLSDEMNVSIFKEMMNCKRKLEKGDDPYSVDVRFGQFMAEQYVYPVVGKD